MKSKISSTLAIIALAALSLLSSCKSAKDIVYFQDLYPGERQFKSSSQTDIIVRPKDKLSITVNSRDPQLMALFNLPRVQKSMSATATSSSTSLSNGSNEELGYTVDTNGDIEFPVLGKLHVAGMNREEIQVFIKNQLISKNLIKDPIITVDFLNLSVVVLGEVNSPGRYAIDKDKTTILDILSMAGDLSIYGRRNNILVVRQDGDMQKVYTIDLTSSRDVYSSPAYYVQQNDMIYVEPNNMKARQSTVNGNTVRTPSFWFSLASLAASLTTIFIVK